MQFKQQGILVRERYSWYKSLYPNTYVDHLTFWKVVVTWGKVAASMMLEGKDVPIYHRMGLLGIRKKENKAYIDYKLTKLAGRPIWVENVHSDYFSPTIYWKKKDINAITNYWSFKGARSLTRGISAVFKTPGGHRKFVVRARAFRKSGLYKKN